MVCSTDRSEAVVPVLVLLFVALWFILRNDLLYVFPCVILFLCFSVLLVLRLPRLGKRELILVLFVRLFGLWLFRFVGFLFLLGSGKGCGLEPTITVKGHLPWKHIRTLSRVVHIVDEKSMLGLPKLMQHLAGNMEVSGTEVESDLTRKYTDRWSCQRYYRHAKLEQFTNGMPKD